MKRALIILALVSMAVAVHAADPTTNALDSTYVKDFITLSQGQGNDSKPIVKFTSDSFAPGSPKAVDGMSFRSSGEIAIHIANLNPLIETWAVEAKATPDLSYAAIKAFLDDLVALQGALPQPSTVAGPPAGGGGPAAPPPCPVTPSVTGCDLLQKLVAQAYASLSTPAITAATLTEIVNGAKGHAGVTDSTKKLMAQQEAIEKSNACARTKLAAIRATFGSLDGAAKDQCLTVTGALLIDYVEVYSTAERIIAAKQALHKQLGGLVEILQPYTDDKVWRGPTLSDYEIVTLKPTFAEQRDITATVKTRTVTIANKSITVKTDDKNVVSARFDARKHSFFVAERAMAMVYNSLTYPDYGTGKNEAGETVIVRVEDRKPIDGAMMLNLVMRLGRGASVVHPMIQLGVSTAKDFPGFLAGAGLRFAKPFSFSISAGGMITRYKDLDDPNRLGKPVSGTAEIQEHLVLKTSPVAAYGAIQLKF